MQIVKNAGQSQWTLFASAYIFIVAFGGLSKLCVVQPADKSFPQFSKSIEFLVILFNLFKNLPSCCRCACLCDFKSIQNFNFFCACSTCNIRVCMYVRKRCVGISSVSFCILRTLCNGKPKMMHVCLHFVLSWNIELKMK